MAKKILCNLPNRDGNPEERCTGVLAHMISPRMIQIGRQGKQKFSILGSNWSAMVTCPKDSREHSIVCNNGVIDESTLTLEEITDPAPGGNPADPNDPNLPGNKESREVHDTPPADPAPVPPADPAPNPAPAA